MNRRLIVALALAATLASACGSDDSPRGLVDGRLVLPEVLTEVSGIAAVDERTLACVQDEAGVVYFVDLEGERAVRAASFGKKGDYEAVAFAGGDLWILRSDGRLRRLVARGDDLETVAAFRLPEAEEYEGLCFDAEHQRLLAMPKGPVRDKKRERDKRRIFAFDLTKHVAVQKPVLTLDLDDLVDEAATKGIELPTRTTSKGKQRADLKLEGSEILVVRGSGDLLLLSAVDHLLLRVDRDGHLLGARRLDPALLPQPEAMTFLADGRLLVASEGVDGPPLAVVVAVPGAR